MAITSTGYYIRILGIHDPNIQLKHLSDALKTENISAHLTLPKQQDPGNWTLIQIKNDKSELIAEIEKIPVQQGSSGMTELDIFREEIREYKPLSAVKWLDEYFNSVQVIYAFQLFDSAFEEDNYSVINRIRSVIWNKTGGILQADHEGFSNEDGFHILWQFLGDVSGNWNFAVLNSDGHWKKFVMDLGSERHRQEFFEGLVPAGAPLL